MAKWVEGPVERRNRNECFSSAAAEHRPSGILTDDRGNDWMLFFCQSSEVESKMSEGMLLRSFQSASHWGGKSIHLFYIPLGFRKPGSNFPFLGYLKKVKKTISEY